MTLLINNQWQPGSGPVFQSLNPADGSVLWEHPAAAAPEVHAAVAAAGAAFEDWARRPLEQRSEFLKAFQQKLRDNKESLASTISEETGKPHWETLTEVAAMIGKVDISRQAYEERTGARVSQASAGVKACLRHRPHGVVAVFGPYNFPGHLPNGHIVPAILAGNTVVFKPSESTPRTAEETLKLWLEAGLPPGVINLVQGERSTGEALAGHQQIDGLFFTGSPGTGTALHRQFAGDLRKILALELGGNNPLIVHQAGDARAAAYNTIQSAYISSGQRCTCARRLIVTQGEAGDRFLAVLTEMIQHIAVGSPQQRPEPFMGPVISNDAAGRLMNFQAELQAQGGRSLVAMQRSDEALPFLTPGLIDVSDIRQRRDEEAFGPLLQVIRTADLDSAMTEANNTRFGLSAGLFSDDEGIYQDFQRRIRAGIVNWNRPLTGASSAAPFGGIGLSGNHRPSAYYAADYCAYPVASLEAEAMTLPESLSPGIRVV